MLGTDEVLFDTKDDVPSSENVQIPDPFEGFSTLEQAVKAAGFEMSVPDAPKGYETAIYRVNTGAKMLEVIYSDKELENNASAKLSGQMISAAIITTTVRKRKFPYPAIRYP